MECGSSQHTILISLFPLPCYVGGTCDRVAFNAMKDGVEEKKKAYRY